MTLVGVGRSSVTVRERERERERETFEKSKILVDCKKSSAATSKRFDKGN